MAISANYKKTINEEIKKYHVEIERLENEIKDFSKTYFYKVWQIAFKIRNQLKKNG